MNVMKEFKEFAMRGNVLDMAIGIIIGGAFGKIITALVNDVIMPPIGVLLGGVDFSELKIIILHAVEETETAEVAINYGSFFQTVIDFAIIVFCVFIVIKGMNKMKKKKEEAPTAPPLLTKEEVLLTEIRDLLKQN